MNMPNRRSEVLVTEFLRDALAVDALDTYAPGTGTPELGDLTTLEAPWSSS
jgi:hypothetical protein